MGVTVFPVSVSGVVRVQGVGADVHATAERIADMLDEAAQTEAKVEGNEVRFKKVVMTGGSSWKILVPFNGGRFQVELEGMSIRVRYSLSTVHMLLIVTVLMGALAAWVGWTERTHGADGHVAAEMFVGGWLWLFGMNYLTAVIRIPLWLKRGLKKKTN